MLNYDPKNNLAVYPISMVRFGLNPYGEPLYRIVATASRRMLVGGLWDGPGDTGATEYRWRPAYRHITEPWVLERWDTCRMTRARWDSMVDPRTGWLLNGPYPERGEYYHAHTFTCQIVDANLDKLISWIEEGQNRSYQDNLEACRKEYDDETKDRNGRMDAIVRNALPAYLDRPFVGGSGVKRGTKTVPLMLNAEDVKLPNGKPVPLGNNKFVNVPARKKRVA